MLFNPKIPIDRITKENVGEATSDYSRVMRRNNFYFEEVLNFLKERKTELELLASPALAFAQENLSDNLREKLKNYMAAEDCYEILLNECEVSTRGAMVYLRRMMAVQGEPTDDLPTFPGVH